MPFSEQILVASDGAAGDGYGSAVAISRDKSTLVIGAPFASGGLGAGQAYVYSGPGWSVETILVASDPTGFGDNYGSSVAVSDDGSIVVVGSPSTGFGVRPGKAYVYSGPSWGTETILTASDGVNGDGFGVSVAVSGDGTIVAAGALQGASGGKGAAYLYHGVSWGTETKIVASDGSVGDAFGIGVSLSQDGSTLAVGASQVTVSAQAFAGQAYVYSGVSWATELILAASTPTASEFFGSGVSLTGDGDVLLVGTFGDSAFVRSGASFASELSLVASDASPSNNFGLFVSISTDGSAALMGAQNQLVSGDADGAAYLDTDSGFTTETKLIASDRAPSDLYGCAVACIDQGFLLVGALAADSTGKAYLYVAEAPTVLTGRIQIAFDDATLEPSPVWTDLDSNDSLVASYTIDRGRQFELDRTDGARATVTINDFEGILDPTNTTGPYYGLIEPLLQIQLRRWNPILMEWQTRFRGFIAEYDYDFDPSQNVNFLRIDCTDIFEIVQSIDMLPGQFGDTPPAGGESEVFFDNNGVGGGSGRIDQVLGNAGIDTAFYVAFSGNVDLWETVYSPGESVMTVIQEAADAEFPGVSNVYTDRLGRLVFHGRLAKFDPATIAAEVGDAVWDWHHWHCGDGTAVAGSPSTRAHIRQFALNRGLSRIINQGFATPKWSPTNQELTPTEVAGQIYTDPVSVGLRGVRSWSAEGLLTKTGLLDSSDSLVETKRFAQYYVDNYAEPRNRVSLLGFRSIRPGELGSVINWKLLCEIDIADQIDVTIASPGGGGLNEEPFFVEGIHEENKPLNGEYDDVTITLDVSPTAYFTSNPFPTS